MVSNRLDYESSLEKTKEVLFRTGGVNKAARELKTSRSTIQHRMKVLGLTSDDISKKPFEAEKIPEAELPLKELIDFKKRRFQQKDAHFQASKLIDIKINIDGPIGILHMGDPHIDDDGADIGLIEKHINLINKTEGLFGANVGDLQNNWVGRLAGIYAHQMTTSHQAWMLVEWLVKSVDWLYLTLGNHDSWQGNGDPLDWMVRAHRNIGTSNRHQCRINLKFPNGRNCRINARHDFHGHSQWNTAHGPAKAVQMGWRDHILACGHTHSSGYQVLKDPSTGLISHALRVASYKTHDDYAMEKGLPDQNIFCSPITIIDPSYPENDPAFITTIFDPERGARILTFLRKEWKRKHA